MQALLLMIGLLQSAFGIILFVSPCAYRDELGTHFSSAAVVSHQPLLLLLFAASESATMLYVFHELTSTTLSFKPHKAGKAASLV